jgi:hypothetical protein
MPQASFGSDHTSYAQACLNLRAGTLPALFQANLT